jgi:hypothetical protein
LATPRAFSHFGLEASAAKGPDLFREL